MPSPEFATKVKARMAAAQKIHQALLASLLMLLSKELQKPQEERESLEGQQYRIALEHKIQDMQARRV